MLSEKYKCDQSGKTEFLVAPLDNGHFITEGEQSMQKKRDQGIDLLKCFAILLVICLHAGLARFQAVTIPSAIGVLEYAARLLFEGVPVFITVNGYLMLGSRHFEIHRHFKKTARLFLLLLIWMALLTFVNSRILHEPLSLTDYWYEFFHTQNGSRYDGQLWFLENLLAVYLIYPVIRMLYDKDFHLYVYVFALFAFFSVGMNTVCLIRDGIVLSHNTDLLNEAIGLIYRFDPTGNAYYVYCFMLGGLSTDIAKRSLDVGRC